MNQSLKSVVAFLIIVSLAAGLLGWTTRGIAGVEGSRFWLRAAGFACPILLALLVWADFRRDRVPDFLRKVAGSYFERDGFCFAIHASVTAGRCVWTVWFQNQYERPCTAVISFRPAVRNFRVKRPPLERIDLELKCPAAGFGRLTVPYPVPRSEQGMKRTFEVAAAVHYSEGRGALLRFRNGIRVSARQKSGLDTAVMAASAVAGHLHFKRAASFSTRLPSGVLETIPPELPEPPVIVWQLGQDTTIGVAPAPSVSG